MANEHLDVAGYHDGLDWYVEELPDGTIKKHAFFPITRYRNNLNRPRVITENSSMAATPNADFHLLTTEVEEVSDDLIYELMGQTW